MTRAGKQNSGDYSCLHPYRYVHIVVHMLGLVLFIFSVLPLTEVLLFTLGIGNGFYSICIPFIVERYYYN